MQIKRRNSGGGTIKELLILLSIPVGAMLAVLLLTAFVIGLTDDPLSYIGVGAIAAVVASGLASGFISYRISGGSVARTLLASLLFSALLFAVGSIASGGVSVSTLINLLIFTMTTLVGSVLSQRFSAKRKRR
ncbi:MAG: hypothetical protein IKC32_05760 [Clostridia bacterium]|nr:hypothetical protein [Clostridia bacterium]